MGNSPNDALCRWFPDPTKAESRFRPAMKKTLEVLWEEEAEVTYTPRSYPNPNPNLILTLHMEVAYDTVIRKWVPLKGSVIANEAFEELLQEASTLSNTNVGKDPRQDLVRLLHSGRPQVRLLSLPIETLQALEAGDIQLPMTTPSLIAENLKSCNGRIPVSLATLLLGYLLGNGAKSNLKTVGLLPGLQIIPTYGSDVLAKAYPKGSPVEKCLYLADEQVMPLLKLLPGLEGLLMTTLRKAPDWTYSDNPVNLHHKPALTHIRCDRSPSPSCHPQPLGFERDSFPLKYRALQPTGTPQP